MGDGDATTGVGKKFAIKVFKGLKFIKIMFCCKKVSYNVENKQKSQTKEKSKEPVLQRNKRLKSFKRKNSADKKNSLTLNFTSYLRAKK